MGHSPSRPNACAAVDALPSRFARFRRRLRLHRRHRSDDSASKAIAADEFAGIARIRIVKVRPAGRLCRQPASCCVTATFYGFRLRGRNPWRI
jgi:hypothetical protein